MASCINLKTMFPVDRTAVSVAVMSTLKIPPSTATNITVENLQSLVRIGKDRAQRMLRGDEVSAGLIKRVASSLDLDAAILVASHRRDDFKQAFANGNTLYAPQAPEAPREDSAEKSNLGAAPSQLPASCHSTYFVRETDISHIKELMNITGDPEKAGDVQLLTSLHGFPGIGKSELAVRLAKDPDVLATFSGGAFWFECKPRKLNSSESKRDHESLLRQINEQLTGDSLGGLPLLRDIQKRLAETLHDHSVLLILDDAWDTELISSVRQAVPSHCSILVTTPVPKIFDERTDERVKVYGVPELSRHDAEVLFKAVMAASGSDVPDSDVIERVLSETALLPATIIIAARVLLLQRSRGLTDDDAVRRIRNDIKQTSLPRVQVTCSDRNISDVLSWSLRCLSSQTLQALSKLPLLGILTATVPESALQSIWGSSHDYVVDELCDIGLIRFAGHNAHAERRFGINHFVYDMAAQLAK